jgi:hypothetical protein
MRGLMQNHQLLISSLVEHAANAHPNTEIVSRTPRERRIVAPMPTLNVGPSR